MNCHPQNRLVRYCSFTVDKSLNFSSIDRNLSELIKRKASEAVGLPYFELLPRFTEKDADLVEEVIRSGKSKVLSGVKLRCFYGSTDAHILIEPLRDGSSKPAGALVMIRLFPKCELFKELEQCQHLINVGKAATSLAHGVRNPLNAIKGSVFYLKKKYAEEKEVFEFAKLAEDEIARLDEFLTNFLSTSNSDTTLAPTDINCMLKRLETFTALQASASEVDYVTRYGEIPRAMVNYFEVEQAIFNVITNALEAMPNGGTLAIETCTAKHAGNDLIIIEITDTGPGIPGKATYALPRRKAEGRGYGLSLSLEVFQRYGGNLTIKSKKGRGTKVRLSIPPMPTDN